MILAGLLIVHIVILFNLNFTAWPEIFSFPYLLNNGFNLYKDMVHPYTPLLTITLSYLFKLFGYEVLVVKLVTYLLILINDFLIFKIVLKLTKNYNSSLLAVLFYILTQPFLEGNQLWYDFAITTPILLGSLLLFNKNYFLSGLSFATAFLIKQNSALFLILAFIYAFKNKNLFKFVFGSVLPIIPIAIYLYSQNSLQYFLNWVLIYPSKYWTSFPNYVLMIPSKGQLVYLFLVFLPFIYLLYIQKIKGNLFLIGSVIISILLIYPRFSFFHFQTGIAFLAVVFGVVTSYVTKAKYVYLYLLLLLILIKKDWGYSVRFVDDNNLVIQQSEKIYLLGPHSLNYVTSHTLPPKPWIDNYGWYFEMPNMQKSLIDGWKLDPPVYIYWTKPQNGNWYDLGTYQPKEVVKYIEENYKKMDKFKDVEVWKLQ